MPRDTLGHWYREQVDDVKLALTFAELADAVRNAPPPTADDVSITWDGRRLDSKEKVLAFLAELDKARENGVTLGPPLP
jgi:hypothetical protein